MFCRFFGRYYYTAIYPGAFLWKPHITLSILTIKYYIPYLMIMTTYVATCITVTQLQPQCNVVTTPEQLLCTCDSFMCASQLPQEYPAFNTHIPDMQHISIVQRHSCTFLSHRQNSNIQSELFLLMANFWPCETHISQIVQWLGDCHEAVFGVIV